MKSNKTSNETNQATSSNGFATATSANRLRKNKVMVNNDYCSFCDEGGDLLSCDRCPVSFHLLCHDPPLRLDQIPKGDFLCNKCKKISELNEKKSSENNGVETSAVTANDTKTIKFEAEENDSVLETLIRIAKSLNPRQMELSEDLNVECAFDLPGLNRIKWWTKDGNKIINVTRNTTNFSSNSYSDNLNGALFEAKNSDCNRVKGSNDEKEALKSVNLNEYTNGHNQDDQVDLCFICSKIAKDRTNSIKCDFCPLRFHLDCLNLPLCSMPSRERLWMCPNHLENFLDQNLVKSSRLSERINLWKEFTFSRSQLNSIKTEFIRKCSKSEQLTSSLSSKLDVKRCQIPESVKNAYISKLPQVDNLEDSLEKEAYLSAVEALTLLSKSNTNGVSNGEQEPHANSYSNSKNNKYIVDPPPLHKFNLDAIKPRALLVPISTMLNESKKNDLIKIFQTKSLEKIAYNSTEFERPYLMRYRYMTIGAASNQDVYLNKCDKISDKHACIYYDELSGHYELLNYGEHGTCVDNCTYGNAYPGENSDSDSESDLNLRQMSSKRLENILNSRCKCSKFDMTTRGKQQWEGAAVLNHGSHIRIGCLNFLFIVVDTNYDFVATASLDASLVNVRKFVRVNKSSLYSVKKQDLDVGNGKEKSNKKLKKLNHHATSTAKSKLLNKLNRKSIRSNNEKIEGFIKLMNNKRKKRLLNSIGSTM